jgi:hypothetical protein
VLPLPDLPRSWPSVELPGYREHPTDHATYSGFADDELPPIERQLDDELRWLLQEPPVRASLADVDEAACTPATAEHLDRVAGAEIVLPRSFVCFVGSDEPRARVRSCTDCYLDLADFAVPVPGGGSLVHFLSDSQWVLHWLLYVGPDGSEAVVATDHPLGFESEGNEELETLRVFDPASGDAAVCTESFSEFLYRFWIENEIWFSLADLDNEPGVLTPEQQRYAEHYARP